MERPKGLLSKINQEQGGADSRVLILGAIAVIALIRICNAVTELQKDVEEFNDQSLTPTPAGINIDSFKNSFNSAQLTPIPEPTP